MSNLEKKLFEKCWDLIELLNMRHEHPEWEITDFVIFHTKELENMEAAAEQHAGGWLPITGSTSVWRGMKDY